MTCHMLLLGKIIDSSTCAGGSYFAPSAVRAALQLRSGLSTSGCKALEGGLLLSAHSHPPLFAAESETLWIFRYPSSSRLCISKSASRSRFIRCCSISRSTPACMACEALVLSSQPGRRRPYIFFSSLGPVYEGDNASCADKSSNQCKFRGRGHIFN